MALRKDDTQNCEAFHILQVCIGSLEREEVKLLQSHQAIEKIELIQIKVVSRCSKLTEIQDLWKVVQDF